MVESGTLQDFADYRSICVSALDQEEGTDLTAVAVSVLVRELPDFSNSCVGRYTLRVTFTTGHSSFTHSTARGPRFGFGHIGRTNGISIGWLAEAAVVGDTGENREEAIRNVATWLANFLKEARATTQPPAATSS